MAKDPVCGMEVDDKTAAGQSVYQGTTYYFCSRAASGRLTASLRSILAVRAATVDTTPTRGIIEPPVSPDLVPEDFRPQSSGITVLP
jgi:hypothetical protein